MSFTKSWLREKRRWQKLFLWRTFVAQRSCCCTNKFQTVIKYQLWHFVIKQSGHTKYVKLPFFGYTTIQTIPATWYPLEFLVIFYDTKGRSSSCARRSLRRLWKLGLRIVVWSKPGMFCEESVGKIRFRAFLKRVSPWILSLKTVEYFGASEHFWVVKKKEES